MKPKPAEIKRHPTTRLVGREILAFAAVESTNDLIKRYWEDGYDEGLVIMADAQSRGKGRWGRHWHSPSGMGIYLSALLRPELPAERIPQLTLMAGAAVAAALDPLCRCKPSLKWPNDVFLNGKKLAGVLCEYLPPNGPGEQRPPGGVVVGIGVNVNHQPADFPAELRTTATSLRIENGGIVDRSTLALSLLACLDAEYQAFLKDGMAALARNWSARSEMFGKKITFSRAGAFYEGVAQRLDDEGRLVMLSDAGHELIFDSGEVTNVRWSE
jgi:BirA family biotin operon repressor/biotin-[acetyl-CoA-carboxylase] ligase